MRKSANTKAEPGAPARGKRLYAALLILALLLVWQLASDGGLVPRFMLPSPLDVARAFIGDFPRLLENLWITLWEAALGLGLGIAAAFLLALLMDRFAPLREALFPLLVLTQTVPPVAFAPLLVLWMGYGTAPKVTLIFLVTFFPITTNLLDGFRSADADQIRLLRSMGASAAQIFRYIKWPSSLGPFFSALKVAASYSIVGAVIAEWLGGNQGLGVYMTRAKASYSYDRMFAVIALISALSLLLLGLIELLRRLSLPWERKD